MTKTILQLHEPEGKAALPASSAPGWFLTAHESTTIPGLKIPPAAPFSEVQFDNHVEFFTTGKAYFEHVAKSIAAASKSIFIAGWQINYDVELTPGKTLFAHLDAALKCSAVLKVYVMPWLSPKVGVDTGDFETMLAVFHLNAGLGGPQRAFCLPAMQQSDMPGGLGIGFSHHQKLVVIDNETAYTGGIDLAYGRRDDGRFLLTADGRKGNELYNSCVPAMHSMNFEESSAYLTRLELLAACSGKWTGEAGAWAGSTAKGAMARALDSTIKTVRETRDFWNNVDLVPDFIDDFIAPVKKAAQDAVYASQDAIVDAQQEAARWAWAKLEPDVRERLEKLRSTEGANSAKPESALLAWLNNGGLDALPAEQTVALTDMIRSLTFQIVARQSTLASARTEPYAPLAEGGRIIPKGGALLDTAAQPRMPWHDVQCVIRGPSVYDLSMNFVRRWNSVALRYDREYRPPANKTVRVILDTAGILPNPGFKAPRIAADCMPRRSADKPGKCEVQVLRSAPLGLLSDEAAAGFGPRPAGAQDNCLHAMLRAIHGAMHFIYIENQFFQSWYGDESRSRGDLSGPMAALLNLKSSPGYAKFAPMLEIENVPVAAIPQSIRWAKVDDVERDPEGRAFLNDLITVLANNASVQTSLRLGNSQDAIRNSIGQALVARIEGAVKDGKPFHVYLVLPAYPEGTLDTLNIMSQVHLTMQSLVFGHDSLVNGVRRAILAKRIVKERGATWPEAKAQVARMPLSDLADAVGDGWKEHLTLLNLRNWARIGGRPVTEQIYVHSKLLIADDRVAILGSANINDRSQLGGRDSELAVIVRDGEPREAKLDGRRTYQVSACVHDLRVALWRKLFGFDGGRAPARELEAVVERPLDPATWRKIQQVAFDNAQEYARTFAFIPRDVPAASVQVKDHSIIDPQTRKPLPLGASLWPTWHYNDYGAHRLGGRLAYRMPFEPEFWQPPAAGKEDLAHTYSAQHNAPESAPEGVVGYIVELPTQWTVGENNYSGMNRTLLAGLLDGSATDHTRELHAASTRTEPAETAS